MTGTRRTRQGKGRLKRLQIRLTHDLYSFYSDLAYRDDISLSAAINRALRRQKQNSGVVAASPDDSPKLVN